MKDKKGFVLAESVVTAVFVLSFFTFIIINLLPLIGEYESNLNYDDIESKYNTHLIRKMLLRDDDCRTFNLVNLSYFPYYEFEGDDICLYLKNQAYCNKLLSKDYLDVKKIIITGYTGESIKNASVANSPFDRTLSDYLKYMPVYKTTDDASVIKARLIVEFNDGRITNTSITTNYNSSCIGGYKCEN